MEQKFKVQFTKDLTKKSQIWEEGIIEIEGRKCKLTEEDGELIDEFWLKHSEIKTGDKITESKYILQILENLNLETRKKTENQNQKIKSKKKQKDRIKRRAFKPPKVLEKINYEEEDQKVNFFENNFGGYNGQQNQTEDPVEKNLQYLQNLQEEKPQRLKKPRINQNQNQIKNQNQNQIQIQKENELNYLEYDYTNVSILLGFDFKKFVENF
ncbi:zinc finger grf-type containing 1 [Anaeramoeba ignava]|uniref:Zinc finger grf-type containing 1 n=1 Tax=Anaeramoeba ignava TaxID=1746090 RepID=A0A9Q0LZW0_ANAIG|nr:zinc finger grf-type containing 1 [Anaeramoeba ignava]